MGVINLTMYEKNALAKIDDDKLYTLINEAVANGGSSVLSGMQLSECGAYVSTQLRRFQQSLADHNQAKSLKKKEETGRRVTESANLLHHAVRQMRQRAEREEKDSELFRIDDHILPPYNYGRSLTVRVSYQWRANTDSEWRYGSIVFSHLYRDPFSYQPRTTKRPPSKAKQREEEQMNMGRMWEFLRLIALCSVRDYFRAGGDGSMIPEAFTAVVEPHSRTLNNFSAKFWDVEPDSAR